MAETVLRFVTQTTHRPYGYRSGVFQIAYELGRGHPTTSGLGGELAEQLAWFEENLAAPARLSVSRHPRAQETAVSWVKASAGEHVRRLRLLAALVEGMSDTRLDELRTTRPGYVVFEDAHQVVALPFNDTPR